MGIDTVLGTAGSILAPFAELLTNQTILGIIALLYILTKFEGWLGRKTALGVYEQELLLERDKRDMRTEILKKGFRENIDFDRIGQMLTRRVSEPTDDIMRFIEEALSEEEFGLRKWK